MNRRFTPLLLVWAVLLLVAGGVAAANHTDEKKVATDGRPGQSTTTAPGGVIAGGEGTVTVPGATDAPSDGASTDGQGGTPGGDDNPTIDPGNGGGTTGTAAKIMPTPGTYTVNVQGTASLNGAQQSIPPQNSFQIIQESATDTRETGDFETVVTWTPESASLKSIKIGQAGKEFRAEPPVLYVPFNGNPTSWDWSLRSTDGKTTIQQSSSITGSDNVDVGGQAVPTFVVSSVLTFDGDLKGTAQLTSWVSPDHRLAVKTHTTVDATFNALFNLKSDTTSVLVSVTPS